MGFAVRYHAWIRDEFGDAIRGDVAEVGAGDGAFSQLLLERNPVSLTLFEPDTPMHQRQPDVVVSDPRVQRQNAIFADRNGDDGVFDTVVYVNVLEHIDDDRGELHLMHRALRDGGRICIFVPALQWLMSDHDRSIGHVRRYGKHELREKVSEAGFEIERLHFFDSVGVLAWWLLMRVLKVPLKAGSVDTYDRFFVPVLRTLEPIVRPPLGKNLLLVARKR